MRKFPAHPENSAVNLMISENELKNKFEKNCEVCGGGSFNVLIDEGRDYEYGVNGVYKVYQCADCGFAFQFPRLLSGQLEDFYPINYANYADSKSLIIQWLSSLYFKKQADEIIGLTGENGIILDIGCSNGHFLEMLKKKGCKNLYGIEVKSEIAEIAKKKGFNVCAGQLTDKIYEENKFDLIRMNHLIEHTTYPSEVFRICLKILKKGGYLYGETPNIDCVDFKILKKYWGCLHLPRHTVFFSENNLRMLSSKFSFQAESISYSPMTPGWSLGFQNFLCDNLKITPENGRLSIYPLLVLASIPAVQIQKFLKKTCVIKFILKKNE